MRGQHSKKTGKEIFLPSVTGTAVISSLSGRNTLDNLPSTIA
jgi:hypothetical protein